MSGRKDRKTLADMRALEEQSERHNLVNPVHNSTRKGYTGLVLNGAGATPSMGLSQFRGGKKSKKEESESEEELEGGAVMVGAGTKKGQMRKTARKAYEHTPSQMGKELAEQLSALHGGAFLDKFRQGFNLVASPNVSGVGFEAVSGGAVSKTGRYEGEGKMVIQHLPEGEGETIITGGRKHKKSRKAPSASDGRRKRAEVVKKVMNEKGLSMIEASKYVKQHGLY